MNKQPISELYALARKDLRVLLDPSISSRLEELAKYNPENAPPLLFITVFSSGVCCNEEYTPELMDILKLLLQNGADPNMVPHYNNSSTILDIFFNGIRASFDPELTEHRKNVLKLLINYGMGMYFSDDWRFSEYAFYAIQFCEKYKKELEEELSCKEPDIHV